MQRVIILVGHRLFGPGVETLLREEEGLEIVGRETDANRAVERIRELQPDVAIVDSADPACDSGSIVMRILREGPRTSVIGVNLEENTLSVYHGERRAVTGVRDLVEAIQKCAAD